MRSCLLFLIAISFVLSSENMAFSDDAGFIVQTLKRDGDGLEVIGVDGAFAGQNDRVIVTFNSVEVKAGDSFRPVAVKPASVDSEEEYGFSYEDPPRVLLNGKTVFTVFIHDREGEQKPPRNGVVADISYDSYNFKGVCKRTKNHKLALMFLAEAGGTGASGQGDVLFVYFDEQMKKVDYEIINLDNWNWKGCLDVARASISISERIQTQQRHILESLSPKPWDQDVFLSVPADQGTDWAPLPIKSLDGDPRGMISRHFQDYKAYYSPPAKSEMSVTSGENDITRSFSLARYNSGISRILETKWYDIYALIFADDCNGEGVLLLHQKKSDRWFGLYNLPGGCSKVDYYWPEITMTTPTQIEGDFCTDCSWWGTYARFQLDLSQKRYRRLPAVKE